MHPERVQRVQPRVSPKGVTPGKRIPHLRSEKLQRDVQREVQRTISPDDRVRNIKEIAMFGLEKVFGNSDDDMFGEDKQLRKEIERSAKEAEKQRKQEAKEAEKREIARRKAEEELRLTRLKQEFDNDKAAIIQELQNNLKNLIHHLQNIYIFYLWALNL